MPPRLKKTLKIVSSVLVIFVVVLAILLAGVRVFGLQIYTVLSPSMEPNYKTGSLIYVKEVDTDTLKERDVITFRLTDSTTATHRIIEIIPNQDNPDSVLFRTKGDNNDEPDTAPVEPERVLGKVVFTVPLLGYLAAYVQSPSGGYIAICFAAALILLMILSDLIADDKKTEKENNEEKSS